jgi:hypothetical protein
MEPLIKGGESRLHLGRNHEMQSIEGPQAG